MPPKISVPPRVNYLKIIFIPARTILQKGRLIDEGTGREYAGDGTEEPVYAAEGVGGNQISGGTLVLICLAFSLLIRYY